MTNPGQLLRSAAKGVFSAVDLARSPFPGPRILIYHRVGAGNGRQMDIRTSVFRAHLSWIATRGKVADLDSAVAGRSAADASSTFVLTFDDGYIDFYQNGFPVLVEYGFPFVLYLTTSNLENPRQTPASSITWDHVEDMLQTGLLTLGSHTHSHPDLRFLNDEDVALEVGRADDLIQRRLGVAVRHFAYPYGYWSKTADQYVRSRYQTAVLGGGSPIRVDTDPFLLHRLPIQLSDGVVFFRRKVARGARTEEWVRRLISGYRGP